MANTPPAPWTWQQVLPPPADKKDGSAPQPRCSESALVAGDGTRLLWSAAEGLLGVHPAVRDLLPLLAPDNADLGAAVVDAEVVVGLLAEVRRLTAERDLARGLAWSYEHRQFDYAALGVELDDRGRPLEPGWLTSPAAPYEPVLDADLARFSSRDYAMVFGEQATGLSVGDCVWVTNKGEGLGAGDVVFAQVREIGDDWVRVHLLTNPTDVRPLPPAGSTTGSTT